MVLFFHAFSFAFSKMLHRFNFYMDSAKSLVKIT